MLWITNNMHAFNLSQLSSYSLVLENNANMNEKEHRHFRWSLTHRQKCPAIKEKFQVQPSSNLTR